MLKHQDHRFPGIERGDGLKIDFDKDPDKKRNQAHARDMKAKARAMSTAQQGSLFLRDVPYCEGCRDPNEHAFKFTLPNGLVGVTQGCHRTGACTPYSVSSART